MPSSVKPTPPQQSSLTEMWGGKKKQKAGHVVAKTEESRMDSDDHDHDAVHGVFYVILFL